MNTRNTGSVASKLLGFCVILAFASSTAVCREKAKPAEEYAKTIAVKTLMATGTTASGQPIVYPKTDSPEVRTLLVEIPAGAETGWHLHPMPAYAYILSGSVTVELKNGTRYTSHAGEAFAETVGVLHNGKNTGTEPVRILMTITSHKGVPTTEKAKSGDDQIVRITDKDGALFSWVHRGELFFRSHGRLQGGEYLYRSRKGDTEVISGNLVKCSEMIREELKDDTDIDSFLLLRFPDAIVSLMGPDAMCRISKEYIQYRKSLPPYAWGEASQREVDQTLDMFKKYEPMGKSTIDKGKWRSEFYVILKNRGIEKWSLIGNTHPFSIEHLEKTTAEKEGAIISILEVGG